MFREEIKELRKKQRKLHDEARILQKQINKYNEAMRQAFEEMAKEKEVTTLKELSRNYIEYGVNVYEEKDQIGLNIVIGSDYLQFRYGFPEIDLEACKYDDDTIEEGAEPYFTVTKNDKEIVSIPKSVLFPCACSNLHFILLRGIGLYLRGDIDKYI